MKEWNGKRYHSLNYFLRNKYGEKIYKIPLDGGFTCPNRDGKVAKGGCTFCSSHGSGDFAGSRILTITEQFDDRKKVMEKKWNKGKYIAYFQAYTNTYAPIEELREKYSQAIEEENVVALSIATRPDCLGDDVLELLEEMSKKVYLWVELGLQTINDETAENFNRGYKFEVFKEGIKKLQDRGIEVVVHSIFGLPGETKEDFEELEEFVEKTKFDKLGTFMYSKEEGTPAARLPEQIHGNTKKSRYNKIMEIQQKVSNENLKNKIGQTVEVLIEDISFDGKYLIGRTSQDVPEEDGIIYVENNNFESKVNTFANVEITDVNEYDLIGKIK